ncbi:hypothetical protein DCC77_01705 [Candidatus Uhrbacteria bacterium]|nr:MAG: hypothetical protein DCC77_01705 [Candidatus Uhrbacteria bacterium]
MRKKPYSPDQENCTQSLPCRTHGQVLHTNIKSSNTMRTYALTMTKPHEKLGLPLPLARQIAQHAYLGWYLAIWFLLFGLAITYIGFITASSAKGFQLRDAERRVERLGTESRQLEMQVASLSSIQAMTEQASKNGFVAVDAIQTINAAGHSYAFAR